MGLKSRNRPSKIKSLILECQIPIMKKNAFNKKCGVDLYEK